MDAVLVVGALATLFMVGVVWFCQIVHYPLFAAVGADGFVAYHARHSVRVTWLIAVPWLVEVASSAILVVERPADVPAWLAVLGAALAAATVVVTALVQGPAHTGLARGYDEDRIRTLVRGNAPRTAIWTAHCVVFAAMLLVV
jgi:hypothetical protein